MKGLNCDAIGGLCAQGIIYYDNEMEAMKYDLDVGDRSGTSIHDANITMISNFTSRIEWYLNVDDNSCTPVVIDQSENDFIYLDVEDGYDEDETESNVRDTINEDSSCKKNDNNNNDCNGNSNNNIFDKDTTPDFGK